MENSRDLLIDAAGLYGNGGTYSARRYLRKTVFGARDFRPRGISLSAGIMGLVALVHCACLLVFLFVLQSPSSWFQSEPALRYYSVLDSERSILIDHFMKKPEAKPSADTEELPGADETGAEAEQKPMPQFRIKTHINAVKEASQDFVGKNRAELTDNGISLGIVLGEMFLVLLIGSFLPFGSHWRDLPVSQAFRMMSGAIPAIGAAAVLACLAYSVRVGLAPAVETSFKIIFATVMLSLLAGVFTVWRYVTYSRMK